MVTGADLEMLERLMKEEVNHMKGMGLGVTITGGTSACRAGAPASSTDSTSPTYSPPKGICNSWVTSLVEANKQCGCCFSTDCFHLNDG